MLVFCFILNLLKYLFFCILLYLIIFFNFVLSVGKMKLECILLLLIWKMIDGLSDMDYV